MAARDGAFSFDGPFVDEHSSLAVERSKVHGRREDEGVDEEGNGLRIYDSSKGSRTIYIAI